MRWPQVSAVVSAVVCALMGSVGVTAPAAVAASSSGARANAVLARMTLEEKLELMGSGAAGVPRLCIPPLRFVDGPNGIGEGSPGVTAFPNAENVGASWDPSLAYRYGVALGGEAAGKGDALLAAPTINIVRSPLWGREPETFGEDPFLTSQLVAPEIRGIQSRQVIAEVKHFAAYNQETGRFGSQLLAPAVNVVASERALQEIYFPGFRAAVQHGGTGSVMCSYNQINGTPSCQDAQTLGVLKGFGPVPGVSPRQACCAPRRGPVG